MYINHRDKEDIAVKVCIKEIGSIMDTGRTNVFNCSETLPYFLLISLQSSKLYISFHTVF